MKRRTYRMTFRLAAEDIDLFSEWLETGMRDIGLERQNRVRVRLLMEEILLRMRDHMGESTTVVATLDTPLRIPRLRVETSGMPYNPLSDVSAELGDWDSSLRTAVGLVPKYSYAGGNNVLRLTLPHLGMKQPLRIAIAVALGCLIGFIGYWIMPDTMRKTIVEVLLTPIWSMWSRLLNAISGPVVFLTVVTTMLNTRGITRKGGNSLWVIVRYFILSIAMVTFAIAFSLIAHPLGNTWVEWDKNLVRDLLVNLSSIVPANIIEPFVESNTSQLLFLAFVLGYVLVYLGDRASVLDTFIRQANMVGLQLAGWMSTLVPIFVGAFLCLELWQGSTSILVDIWRPLVLALSITLVILVFLYALVSLRLRVPMLSLAKKLWPPFITAIKTGSLDQSFGEVLVSCTRYLGIDQDYAKEALPQGLVLYMPASAIGTIVFTLFAAQVSGVQGHVMWYVSAVVMAVVVFVATPPVPGANLLAYVVLFSTLGVPAETLIDAMTFDIIFGIFAGAANQTMLQLEMIRQASKFGLLDTMRLRSKMP